jgi:hypothetical protein
MFNRKPSEKSLSAADRKLMQDAYSAITSFYDSSEDRNGNPLMQDAGRVIKRLRKRLGYDH